MGSAERLTSQQELAGVDAAVSMMTKGGLNTITRSLAVEYAKAGLRCNAVAPGVVNTHLRQDDPQETLRTLQPMGSLAEVKDIVAAVLSLARARQVTGQVLYVDGGAHVGRW
jgi:NAD(P)-dependent dehydrogenase (short-subunit alcohol dehydrogenase family)